MSVPNLSAVVLNLVGREAGPRAAPATPPNATAVPAPDFLKYLPVAETATTPFPQAESAIRALASTVDGKPSPGRPTGSPTPMDARQPKAEDATAAINVWLPMVDHAPITVATVDASSIPVESGQMEAGLNAPAGRAQVAPVTVSVRSLNSGDALSEALDADATTDDAATDVEMLSADLPAERGAIGRELVSQSKSTPAAMPAEPAATPQPAREGAAVTAVLPESLQQATTAGNGLERLLAEPAVAQDRLFVSRPGAEPLADPRYTLDASAGPQRLAETAAQRLSWMAGEKISRADLALNPPELGSVDVQMEVEGDQVRIQMSTATGAAKEMLDQALPRLRELFAQEGLQLTQADVSQHREQDARGRSADGSQARNLHGQTDEAQDERAAEESAPPTRHSHIGLLDQYA